MGLNQLWTGAGFQNHPQYVIIANRIQRLRPLLEESRFSFSPAWNCEHNHYNYKQMQTHSTTTSLMISRCWQPVGNFALLGHREAKHIFQPNLANDVDHQYSAWMATPISSNGHLRGSYWWPAELMQGIGRFWANLESTKWAFPTSNCLVTLCGSQFASTITVIKPSKIYLVVPSHYTTWLIGVFLPCFC